VERLLAAKADVNAAAAKRMVEQRCKRRQEEATKKL